MSISEAIKKYVEFRKFQLCHKALPNDIIQLFQFAVFMRNTEIEDVSLENVQEYIGLWSATGINHNTVFRKANSFKQFFNFLARRGYRVINPDLLPKIKMCHHKPRVATEEEYRKFLDAIPNEGYPHNRNAALVSMLYDTYARVNEILPLNIATINPDYMGAIIKTEKVFDEDERRVFWRDETKSYLFKWLEARAEILRKKKARDNGELFITVGGGNCQMTGSYRALSYAGVKDWFHEYSKRAGLERALNPHSLRHKGGQEMAINDYDPYVIASILGHKSIESSLEYARLYGNNLKAKYYGIKK